MLFLLWIFLKACLAEDIAPNRLEKAKQIISKTIDKLGSDRVGIIIYAGNSYPLVTNNNRSRSRKYVSYKMQLQKWFLVKEPQLTKR